MSRKEQLAPIDIMIYNRIKSFTEKGELKFCCESNKKIGEIVQRHQANVSRSINKLSKLKYIIIEREGLIRKLKSTNKLMSVTYYYNKKDIDESAKGIDESAKLIDKLAKLNDKSAKALLTKVRRLVDESAKHNIYINIYSLINNLKKEIKESFDFIKEENWKELFLKWIDYRIQIKKPLKPVSYKAAFNRLKKLSKSNFNIANEIIETSIANGWQGLFELKKVNKKNITQKNREILLKAYKKMEEEDVRQKISYKAIG